MYQKDYYNQLKNYVSLSSKKEEINWFDLPKTMYMLINLKDTNRNRIVSIKKLYSIFGKKISLNKMIKGTLISSKKGILKMNYPIKINQMAYFKIYALMLSEGTFKTEFSLNVPEKEFHEMFEKNLKRLISREIIIKKDLNKNFERSRAPTIIRHILPLQNHLPLLLFKNKEFAREYLKIAFEAEGCPIYNLKKSKKYIKLSRNSDVSDIFDQKDLPKEKRLFINEIKNKFSKEYLKIIEHPDELILGEYLLLKSMFNIESSLKLECIRLNKLGNRKGKISAKWVLYIYGGEDLKKFNYEIGFLSKNKIKKCKEMLNRISSRQKQYYPFKIMKETQKKNIFLVKDFNKKMKSLGYISPQKFVWDYMKNKKLIERVNRGEYRIINK
jgi:hypothetical protein